MMNLRELRSNKELTDEIDWDMTQEKAIDMYLEWGNGWGRGNDFVSCHGQGSFYFVLFDWEDLPQATLIHRTMKDAEEIAKIPVPEDLFSRACRGRRLSGRRGRPSIKPGAQRMAQ